MDNGNDHMRATFPGFAIATPPLLATPAQSGPKNREECFKDSDWAIAARTRVIDDKEERTRTRGSSRNRYTDTLVAS